MAQWDMIVARWVLGLIPSEALPRVATEALEAGLDTPSLRRLAGGSHPTLGDTGPIFEQALDELGVAVPDRARAGLVLAKAYAAQIAEGRVSPYEGARHIWDIELGVDGLMTELGPFVYWASEWQDADGHERREECEAAIRAAAAELLGAA